MRSEMSLIQTIGRAARNAEGEVIMYADNITKSMRRAIDETERRRQIQSEYNEAHGIVPKTIKKNIRDAIEATKAVEEDETLVSREDAEALIEQLRAEMIAAAEELEFEKAAQLRDRIAKLKKGRRRG